MPRIKLNFDVTFIPPNFRRLNMDNVDHSRPVLTCPIVCWGGLCYAVVNKRIVALDPKLRLKLPNGPNLEQVISFAAPTGNR